METVFGFGAHSVIGETPDLLRPARQADLDGLDLLSLSDHPYLGERLDAYAAVGFILGGSAAQWAEELTGAVLEHGASGFT